MEQKFNSIWFCLFLYFLGIIGLGGCQTVPYQGTAREVKKRPQEGGVIALPISYRNEDQSVARQKMESNCSPRQVKVLEEGEVAVGSTTRADEDKSYHQNATPVGTLFGLPVVSNNPGSSSSSTATTTQIKEWQISYQCALSPANKDTNVKTR